jgi:[acyl-carrier-protein] S-malonyltransferase
MVAQESGGPSAGSGSPHEKGEPARAELRGGLAFVFPGQASQREGMAAALLAEESEARSLFDGASEILGLNLAEICTTGDQALLTRTDVAQPALLTTCLAWEAALRRRGVRARTTAGHSLGEFSAWVAAGALGFEEAVRLVRRRGELMEEAATRRPGGMVAVIGLPNEQVEGICRQAQAAGVVVPANYNSPGQVVVSGDERGLRRVGELVKAAGAKSIPLRVSGAFHSSLMEDAARAFSGLVAKLQIRDPRVPVVVNATAAVVTEAEQVRRAMTVQMTSPVRWTECVRVMRAKGVSAFLEVGPGQVLTKLIQRTLAEVRCLPVGTPEELRAVVKEMGE